MIAVEQFCDAVQSEFFSNIIANALADCPDNISEELLMSDLNSELRMKLSIDEEYVSINALELFTREFGLSKTITNLVNECVARQKQQMTSQINDTIVSELAEVKEMLDLKAKQIAN